MDERMFFPATSRNREHITKVLEAYLPKIGNVLEIASGSGEHAISFQRHFPKIIWQASDPNSIHRKSIRAWIKHDGLEKVMPAPLNLKVEVAPWPFKEGGVSIFNAIVSINLLHISSWICCEKLFHGASKHLYRNSPIIIYGPFMLNGKHTSKSNAIFDQNLKNQNPKWGVRNLDDVCRVARNEGFKDPVIIQMPANNISVIFQKL